MLDRSNYLSEFSGAGDMHFSESTANIYFSESTATSPLDEMEIENDTEATLIARALTAAQVYDTNEAPGQVGTRPAISSPGGDPCDSKSDDGRQDLHGIANNRSDLMDLEWPESLDFDEFWQDVSSPAASRPGESYPSNISHESQQPVCAIAAAANDSSDLNLQPWTASSDAVTVSDANTSCLGRTFNSLEMDRPEKFSIVILFR